MIAANARCLKLSTTGLELLSQHRDYHYYPYYEHADYLGSIADQLATNCLASLALLEGCIEKANFQGYLLAIALSVALGFVIGSAIGAVRNLTAKFPMSKVKFTNVANALDIIDGIPVQSNNIEDHWALTEGGMDQPLLSASAAL
jgi:hypothetical protein